MAQYTKMTQSELSALADKLQIEYQAFVAKGMQLDLSRGKPDSAQLDLTMGMMNALDSTSSAISDGVDCRNYGVISGIPEARRLMADILDVLPENVMVGGNSSLNLMHDCISIAYIHGLPTSKTPWCKLDQIKFLCPSPGYDRHFAVSAHFGFELVTIPMTETGPNMDLVESLVAADSSIKGMWCIPKYSNPQGITYSDETVRRLANLKPAATDFCIFYDNSYVVHDLYPDEPDHLLPLLPELIKEGNADMAIQFTSTSKISFPGAGISALATSTELLKYLVGHFELQTIGYDKLNQLRHVRYFKDFDGVKNHMRKQAELLLPKFDLVLNTLENELSESGIAYWDHPRGGYFISLNILEGCAKRVVQLCKDAGVVLTPAGATYPYGDDPADSNLRIAPTFAKLTDVKEAAALLCLCVRLACAQRLLAISPA